MFDLQALVEKCPFLSVVAEREGMAKAGQLAAGGCPMRKQEHDIEVQSAYGDAYTAFHGSNGVVPLERSSRNCLSPLELLRESISTSGKNSTKPNVE